MTNKQHFFPTPKKVQMALNYFIYPVLYPKLKKTFFTNCQIQTIYSIGSASHELFGS